MKYDVPANVKKSFATLAHGVIDISGDILLF